jgi:phosphoserine aminotransferase
MSEPARPAVRPANPRFSTGPTAKRPGWTPEVLAGALIGRSHRAPECRARLKRAIEETRDLLAIPGDYRIAIVAGSDTGAIEMAMWSLLGARGVDVLAWESFGKSWASDVVRQLALKGARVLEADYGALPDLAEVDFDRDVIFTWNGTTSGVRVPDADWIAADRKGLTLCDATSAVFAQDLNWAKLDVVTFSWQKVMGSEAQHGMIVLSPRAAARLAGHTPPWPVPKIFRLTKGGALIEGVFAGETINTPSMLCVEDYLDALAWARGVGGQPGLKARADANFAALAGWVEARPWIDFLARDAACRSNTSVCLELVAPEVAALDAAARWALVKRIEGRLAAEGVAYDIAGHRDAPPNLRVWCGSTVQTSDIAALTGWLDWGYGIERAGLAAAA